MKRVLTLLVGALLALLLLTLGMTQDLPIGSVSGTVVMKENGKPLPNVLVVFTPSHTWYDWSDKEWHATTHKNGSFTVPTLPAGDYNIDVSAENHSLKAMNTTVAEGKPTPIDLQLTPNEPGLTMFMSSRVVAPDESPRFQLEGFVTQDRFTLTVRRVKLQQIVQSGGTTQALQPISGEEHVTEKALSAVGDVQWSKGYTISKRNIEGSFTESFKLDPFAEGLYLITARSQGCTATKLLNVSRIGLVTKSTPTRTLCYVTDIQSGKPIPSVPVSIGNGGSLQPCGYTDGRGLLSVSLAKDAKTPVVVATKGKSLAICNFSLGNEGGDDDATDATTRIFTYAERPVYRPGDTVQFKSIVRKVVGPNLVLPPQGNAKVEIYDSSDDLVQTQRLPLNAHGTLHGSFSTDVESKPGVYRIVVSAFGGEDTYYANMAAYRKPDYSISVTADKPRFILGQTASATIDCQYFFGGPVVGAKVTATIYRSPAWDEFDPDEDGDIDSEFNESSDDVTGGELVSEVNVTTDGTGHAKISFPTAGGDIKYDPFFDYRYGIQVSVDETGGTYTEGSGSVFVSRGDFRLKTDTDPYIAAVGDTVHLTVSTTSLDRPVKPQPNRPVSVVVGKETYTRHAVVFQPITSLSLTTDKNGTVSTPIPLTEKGDIEIKATALDNEGHKIESESWVYVEGSALAVEPNTPKISLKLDRHVYKPGDTAKALIRTSLPGGVALVTVEAGEVMLVRTVPMDSPTEIVRLPVEVDDTPNAFVTVAYVRNRSFLQASHSLTVSRNEKHLSVRVTPSTKKLLPEGTVAYRIKTADPGGKGVPAEVSLGVVDESIYSIRKDATDIQSGLYPEKSDLVQTNYSFAEIYLDGGDKGGGPIPVRRKFRDTAWWAPDVETDSNGNAEVTVKLPDNLTSWRATAVAATDGSAVGMTTANVQVSKPLMVRLLTPPFMVASDKQEISAAVTNDSGVELDVTLLLKPTGVSLTGSNTTDLHLANGETKSMPFEVATDASGTGDLVAEVRSNKGFTDAVDGHFPVLPHGRLVVDRSSGVVTGTVDVDLNALGTRDHNTGDLNLVITPSPVSALLQSIDSLVQFPYGCVEQTLSRFLPAVLIDNTVKGTPLAPKVLRSKVEAIARDGFARLQKMQHDDGAWGWWVYDESDPFMTAWVLDGLHRAKNAGFARPGSMELTKTVSWLSARLLKPEKGDADYCRLFMAFALSESGDTEDARRGLTTIRFDKLGPSEFALAALAAHGVSDGNLEARMLDQLKAHLSDPITYHLWHPSLEEDEVRAFDLLALAELGPHDKDLPKLAYEILKSRGCYGWASTRATAVTVAALCDYMKTAPQLYKPSQLRIALGGKILEQITVDPAKPDSPDLRVRVPIAQLADGVNRLSLDAKGGSPFYATELRQYDVQPKIAQSLGDNKLWVQRRYLKLEARKLEDGTMKLLPTPYPISSAKPGDVIRCVIHVHSTSPLEFLMIEDPIPSNCRVTDREDPGEGEEWNWWWSSIVIMDDRVSLFCRDMSAGDHELSYTMRVENPGTSSAMPTHLEEMYAPSVSASSGESLLEAR